MNNKFAYIDNLDFTKLLTKLSKTYDIVLPVESKKDYFWQSYKGDFQFAKYRAVTSIRQFLTPCVEPVGAHPQVPQNAKPFCIVGAKACDLSNALKVQDYVFLEGDVDENYKKMRQENLIISSDCTSFKETCFCHALGIKPYPEELFDLNISQLPDGYIVEAGSTKGEKIISENKTLFKEIKWEIEGERDKRRNDVVKRLTLQVDRLNFPKKESLYQLIKNGYNNPMWKDEALRCVECGACIMNCPTCHCFLLFDTKDEKGYFKGRIWDGCQYKNFTRVAGGASALRFREYRLRNRYIKKFEFFSDRINLHACTGCGRCIEDCPAKIDLRKIFLTLEANQQNKI
ncbi:MAG: 4Fe-4S dicluster domain-containing protein [Candidatus Omnitrophota bacterium]|jgi:ferredoxin